MSLSFLIVGLGNPGAEYAKNRHNIGFMAADAMARAWKAPHWQNKFQAELCEIKLPVQGDTRRGLLIKPQTYMNLSGQAVGAAAQFYKIPPEHIFVLHDEIDLIPGRVRLKQGGGHAGHNGLKSLDGALGPNYWRLRMGVGRPPMAEDVSHYVLGNFSKADMTWVEKLCDVLAENAPLLLGDAKDHTALLNKLAAACPTTPQPQQS